MNFVYCFQSEWLKKKRSLASWLIVLTALFMPALVFITRVFSPDRLYAENLSKHFWEMIYFRNWAAMGMFLLPLSLILSTSLFANLEFKNNTWKQLHTTPQQFSTLFLARLSVILVMLVQLFVVFNIGIYLSALAPALVYKGIQFPKEIFPFVSYMKGNCKFFIDCLPVVALQYLLSLKFKNFIVSVGIGFSVLVASLLAMNWKYGYLIPYTYCPLNFKENQGKVDASVYLHVLALGYFVLFTVISYLLYIHKKERG